MTSRKHQKCSSIKYKYFNCSYENKQKMKPCIRCGRWIDKTERDECININNNNIEQQNNQNNTSTSNPLPLNFLKNFPAAVFAWNSLQHQKNQSENNNQISPQSQQFLLTNVSTSSSTATRRNNTNNNNPLLNSPSTSLNNKQKKLLMQHTEYLCCNLPDCIDPVTKLKTDTSDSCQPEKWEFAVPCNDCGRVWPVPVPHPSSFTCGKTMNPYFRDDPKRFVCADYPLVWKQAVLNNASKDTNNKKQEKSIENIPTCPSLDPDSSLLKNPMSSYTSYSHLLQQQNHQNSQNDKNKNKDDVNDDDYMNHPPSTTSTQPIASNNSSQDVTGMMMMMMPTETTTTGGGVAPPLSHDQKKPKKSQQQKENKNIAKSASNTDPPVISQIEVRSFALPPLQMEHPEIPAKLNFMSGCLPESEKLKETTKRARDATAMTKRRFEAAQVDSQESDTPRAQSLENNTIVKNKTTTTKKTTSSSKNKSGKSSVKLVANENAPTTREEFLSLSQLSQEHTRIPLNSSQQATNQDKYQSQNNQKSSSSKQKDITEIETETAKQKAFERLQHLAFAMRGVSTVSARSGLVGVSDSVLDDCYSAFEPPTSKNRQHEEIEDTSATTSKKQSGKRRGRPSTNTKEEDDQSKAPENSAATSTSQQKHQQAHATAAAAVAAAGSIEYDLGSEEIHWARCLKCNKWRVLGVDHIEDFKIPESFFGNVQQKDVKKEENEKTVSDENNNADEEDPLDLFECAMLPGGVNCATKNEASYQKPALLLLKRRRAAFLKPPAAGKTLVYHAARK